MNTEYDEICAATMRTMALSACHASIRKFEYGIKWSATMDSSASDNNNLEIYAIWKQFSVPFTRLQFNSFGTPHWPNAMPSLAGWLRLFTPIRSCFSYLVRQIAVDAVLSPIPHGNDIWHSINNRPLPVRQLPASDVLIFSSLSNLVGR